MLYLIIQQFEDFVKDKIMKVEKIYEIPVNEAFDKDCECALCFLEKNLEDKNTEFFLGPAMMKPEFRIETNKKGFCRRHLSKMLENQNRLPLSLMLDTHLNSLNEILDRKKGIKKTRDIDFVLTELSALENSCAVCDYINDTFPPSCNQAAAYVGGSSNANNIKVYIDNCTFKGLLCSSFLPTSENGKKGAFKEGIYCFFRYAYGY